MMNLLYLYFTTTVMKLMWNLSLHPGGTCDFFLCYHVHLTLIDMSLELGNKGLTFIEFHVPDGGSFKLKQITNTVKRKDREVQII